MKQFKSLNGFLNSKPGYSQKTPFLRRWASDPDKKSEITVFLHTSAPQGHFYEHNIPQIVAYEKDGVEQSFIGKYRFICHEPDHICESANRIDKITGRREQSPAFCPIDLMLEWISIEVHAGRLKLSERLFYFEAGGKQRMLHAGGVSGIIKYKYEKHLLDEKEKAELQKAGIKMRDVGMESLRVRGRYLMQVVDADEPGKGLVKAIESPSLVKNLQKKLKAEMESNARLMGAAKNEQARKIIADMGGNPLENPYAIKFTRDPKANPQEQYDVVLVTSDKPSDEILELINGEPLALGNEFDPADPKILYGILSEHLVYKKLPLDKFFEAAFASKPGSTASKKGIGYEQESEREEEASDADEDAASTSAVTSPCDVCRSPLPDDAYECSECGAVYTVSPDDAELLIVESIPCLKCGEPIPHEEGQVICPKCGTIHVLDGIATEDADWHIVEPPPPPAPKEEAPKRAARRGSLAKKDDVPGKMAQASSEAATATPSASDGIPWGKSKAKGKSAKDNDRIPF
jgi:uncharacterized Zn finger protein (UPF0148 family)